ncbi:hypothetical protein T439DRAFT_380250 [Meredithblackwellia eburnea MCA 4105]
MSRSPSPTLQFSNLNIDSSSQAGALLQDEDLTLTALGTEDDESFDLRPPAATATAPTAVTKDTFYSIASASNTTRNGRVTPTPTLQPATQTTTTTPSAPRDPPNTVEDDQPETQDWESYTEEEKQLIQELDVLKKMNADFAVTLKALQAAEGKIDSLNESIRTSHSLLNLYHRLTAAAEETQETVLDPNWGGVTAAVEQQRAAEAEWERLRLEEEERERERKEQERLEREAEQKRAEEKERLAAIAAGRRGKVGSISRGGLPSTRSRGGSTIRGRVPSGPSPSSTSVPVTSATSSTRGATTSGRGSVPVTGVRGVRGIRSRVGTAGTSGRGRGV